MKNVLWICRIVKCVVCVSCNMSNVPCHFRLVMSHVILWATWHYVMPQVTWCQDNVMVWHKWYEIKSPSLSHHTLSLMTLCDIMSQGVVLHVTQCQYYVMMWHKWYKIMSPSCQMSQLSRQMSWHVTLSNICPTYVCSNISDHVINTSYICMWECALFNLRFLPTDLILYVVISIYVLWSLLQIACISIPHV